VRGAFEYQGQKCSAASRAYLPRSLWDGGLREELADLARTVKFGDITDFSLFGGAVIDARAFAKHRALLSGVDRDAELDVLVGGNCDDSVGYFVEPTVLVSENPGHEVFATEYFGPILAVHVYPDADYERILRLVDETSPYALTGAVFADDRAAVQQAHRELRFAAGNFYVNDKPTGSIVGQQPFGGSRASGTNDKAGSMFNLLRWASPRSVKETFDAPTDIRYPHMG
jgi:1-pyrroline-5-carboxylate dehydrogenase